MSPHKKLRAVVVDDEAPARRKILRFLKDEPGVEVVGEADSGEAALEIIQKHSPDLIFLDVQMPGMDGFGVLESLSAFGPDSPQIIFTTAHDKFALRAFDVHALDYLLKPIAEERFRAALKRAQNQGTKNADDFSTRLQAMLEQLERERSFPERILIHENERAFFVLVRDIAWIESERNYLLIHCAKKTHTIRGTLDSLLKSLDPKLFVRINRGNLVRLDAIREMVPWFHGEYKVIVQDGTELRWSRRYVSQRPELLKLS
jgi:two-component system, LytTR family, response regulator